MRHLDVRLRLLNNKFRRGGVLKTVLWTNVFFSKQIQDVFCSGICRLALTSALFAVHCWCRARSFNDPFTKKHNISVLDWIAANAFFAFLWAADVWICDIWLIFFTHPGSHRARLFVHITGKIMQKFGHWYDGEPFIISVADSFFRNDALSNSEWPFLQRAYFTHGWSKYQ